MKRNLLKITLGMLLLFCFGYLKAQTRQLEASKVLELFQKSKTEIHKELNNKGYYSSKNDSGFEVFLKSTAQGTYTIVLDFKSQKLNVIGWQEHVYFFRHVTTDLQNNFNCKNQDNPDCVEYMDRNITMLAFQKKGYIASLTQRKDGSNVININIGKDNSPDKGFIQKQPSTQNSEVYSNENRDNEPALIKNIFEKNGKKYISLDIVQIKYEEYGYKIINQNPKIRIFEISDNLVIQDNNCRETIDKDYLIRNKERLIAKDGEDICLFTANNGVITEINLGCWN